MADMQMTEDQAVNFMRNALLVAGHEMGEEGDHWPVIKNTVYQIMKDHEYAQIERNVFDELRIQYGAIIERLEKNLENCPAQIRPQVDQYMQNIRDAYEACFTEPDPKNIIIRDEDIPIHVKRADMIVKTLEDENG